MLSVDLLVLDEVARVAEADLVKPGHYLLGRPLTQGQDVLPLESEEVSQGSSDLNDVVKLLYLLKARQSF